MINENIKKIPLCIVIKKTEKGNNSAVLYTYGHFITFEKVTIMSILNLTPSQFDDLDEGTYSIVDK